MGSRDLNIKNRKASFEYQLIETYTAGIQLTGTEIKSVREGKVSIAEAFCVFIGQELWVKNMDIAPYRLGHESNHEPKRLRKLLLHKEELRKIFSRHKEKGLALIPLRMFISDRGLAKLDIALAKGKKIYDKRESIRLKEVKKQMKNRQE